MTKVLNPSPRVFHPVVSVALGAMAGGMGWGIRGQYGHETGAMIAGVLIGCVVAMAFLPGASSLRTARVIALCAVGICFGGSMTYGQTIGLTHDAALIGNWQALAWGLTGLAVKGGIWIGFAGAFLGIGLSAKTYRPQEMALLLAVMFVLMIAGIRLLNSPFDPSHRLLPSIYFSDDWRWEPDADLKPRPEVWGGLLIALAGLTAYVSLVRRDPLVRNLTLTAFVAGAIGFPAGQCLQAFHAWNPECFADDRIAQLDRHINWWNMMEITFGTIAGGGLAFGTWWNRRLIVDDAPTQRAFMKPVWECLLVVPHVTLLVAAGFADVPALEFYLQFGFVMSLLPVIGITGGRWWPWLFALPIVAVPIAAKTVNELAYKTEDVSRHVGWIMFVLIPIGVALFTAVWLTRIGADARKPIPFAATALLISSWLYFWLNFAFFRHPWPWNTWTSRTPSALIFTVCIASLTAAAIYGWRTAASSRVESRGVA